eukprot:scaffold94542_cov27-Phaeocystis_antarctica.AAC.1
MRPVSSGLQPFAPQAATLYTPGDPRIEDEVVDMLRQMLTEESRALQVGILVLTPSPKPKPNPKPKPKPSPSPSPSPSPNFTLTRR